MGGRCCAPAKDTRTLPSFSKESPFLISGWDAWRHFTIIFRVQKWHYFENVANATILQKLQTMERIAISAVAAEAYVEALGIIQNILLYLKEVTENDKENAEAEEWLTYRERVMGVFCCSVCLVAKSERKKTTTMTTRQTARM